MADGGARPALSASQVERLRVRLAVGPRALISRVEARYLFSGRDSEVDAICRRLPFRTVGEDGAPLYEYGHVLDAMPLRMPDGIAPVEPTPQRVSAHHRVAMEDL